MSDPPAKNPLRDSPAFRRLWIARTISQVGDGIAVLALVLFVQETHRTGVAVGGLLLAAALPRFLGPLAGVVVDRVEQRSLMIACDLGQAAVFVAIAWLEPSYPILLAMVAATGALDTLFGPAGRSAVPALVRPEQLLRANAWMGTSLNMRVAVGPVVGGLLVALFDVRGALVANAATFVVSALVLLGLPPLRAARSEEAGGFLAVGAEGLRFAWRTPVVRTLVIALFLGVAFAAVDDVALVFLVRETLDAGPLAFGLVGGAYGVGMLAGSLGLSWKGTAAAAGSLFVIGWILSGVGTILTGVAPLVVVAAVGQAVAGIGNGIDNVATDTLIQQAVPREMLGRVFGLVATAPFAGSTLAYAAGGFLLDLTDSPRAVFLIGGIGVLVVILPVLLMLRRAGPDDQGMIRS
jgi:MFS family permease